MTTVLTIEDNETLREGVAEVVEGMGHVSVTAPNGAVGLEAFEECEPELVITDLKMDEVGGMEVLEEISSRDSDALVMIITAFGSIERAVEAMKAGAFDFLPKPFPPELLREKIAKALDVYDERRENERLESENEMLRRDAGIDDQSLEIIGESAAIESVFERIEKVAPTDSTVYIHGESGTGKELVARAIHENSRRAEGPFVKVNCAALAESLLESELFGHEKGAFTGAHERKIGRFELADGGTIFLDEIGDISPNIQLKLLRVLQEREIERVGGEETISIDVRVIAATNRDLEAAVEEGGFREDLFYRLHIIPIELPPLRQRKEDIPLLVDHFIERLADRTRAQVEGIAPEAMETLKAHDWPGNVRELENSIEHALVFAEGNEIEIGDLPPSVTGAEEGGELAMPEGDRDLPEILDDLERQLVVRAFREADGVKTETAERLGINTSALYYKLDKYDIDEEVLDSGGTEE
ncbi:MAG: sigma-54-dependent transcriptional regulator [Bradymonadaceae bacterium]